MDISKSEIYSILSSVQMLSRKDYQAIHRDPNKVTKYFIIQVTLDNSKFTGPSINFERSRVRVFKSPEIFEFIIGFKFTITGSLGLSSFYTRVY